MKEKRSLMGESVMWVLLDESGKYFKGWSDYAPATTDDLQEAHTFDSKQSAKDSAAYRYSLMSFVPVEVEVTVKIKAA